MLETPALASECRYARAVEMHAVVAARLWELIDAAIETHGRALIALAGGSTPVPIYNLLREMPLPWDQLTISPTDERWVQLEEPASNEGMLRRELLGPDAAGVELVSMARRAADPGADAAAADQTLARLGRPFDVALLGMGADGHTASWFPDARGLDVALSSQRHCVAVEPPATPEPRLTLTRAALLSTGNLLLVIGGAEKWAVYRDAIADPARYPVGALLQQQSAPLDVYWAAD